MSVEHRRNVGRCWPDLVLRSARSAMVCHLRRRNDEHSETLLGQRCIDLRSPENGRARSQSVCSVHVPRPSRLPSTWAVSALGVLLVHRMWHPRATFRKVRRQDEQGSESVAGLARTVSRCIAWPCPYLHLFEGWRVSVSWRRTGPHHARALAPTPFPTVPRLCLHALRIF